MRLTRRLIAPSEEVIRFRMVDTAFNEALGEVTLALTDESKPEVTTARAISLVFPQASVQLGAEIGSLTDHLAKSESQSSLFKMKNPSEIQDFPFYIDPTTGNVFTLTRSISKPYSASMVLGSISGQRPPVSIDLTILPSESHKAGFEGNLVDPVNISVPEDTSVGTDVYRLDTSRQLSYDLFEQVPSEGTFSISSSGMIELTQPLDYEAEPVHVLTVRAHDPAHQGSSLLTVVVNVEDRNDNPPKIVSRDQLTIYPDTPLNHPLMTVLALDDDSSGSSKSGGITYAIADGNYDGAFGLDFNSGVLKLVRPPSSSSYSLTLTASDRGRLRTTQTLLVNVERLEDGGGYSGSNGGNTVFPRPR